MVYVQHLQRSSCCQTEMICFFSIWGQKVSNSIPVRAVIFVLVMMGMRDEEGLAVVLQEMGHMLFNNMPAELKDSLF